MSARSLLEVLVVGAATALPAVAARAQVPATVYDFQGGIDGSLPYGEMADQAGMLYGTTAAGGGTGCKGVGCGTVFSFDTKTNTETVLYRFAGGQDGYAPTTGVIYEPGRLYGVTLLGGGNGCSGQGCGTVFMVDPATHKETVLYRFTGGADGFSPSGGLVYSGAKLYGVVAGGGTAGLGAVFSVNPVAKAEATVYSFKDGMDAAEPTGRPIVLGNVLYGTALGGKFGAGAVFAINLSSGGEVVIYSYQAGPNGFGPVGGLIYHAGDFYGTTAYGGSTYNIPPCSNQGGCGTVFKLNPKTSAYTVLYSFGGGSDACFPQLTLAYSGGALFGTTVAVGGICSDTLFGVNAVTGAETTRYQFTNNTTLPSGLAAKGITAYGLTERGGNPGAGTLYKLTTMQARPQK